MRGKPLPCGLGGGMGGFGMEWVLQAAESEEGFPPRRARLRASATEVASEGRLVVGGDVGDGWGRAERLVDWRLPARRVKERAARLCWVQRRQAAALKGASRDRQRRVRAGGKFKSSS